MDSSDDDYDEVVLGQTRGGLPRPTPGPAAAPAAVAASSASVPAGPPAEASAPASAPTSASMEVTASVEAPAQSASVSAVSGATSSASSGTNNASGGGGGGDDIGEVQMPAQQQPPVAVPSLAEQQKINSMEIGNAAMSALHEKKLGRDEAVAEVRARVLSLMPDLDSAQATSVAAATVDALVGSQPMLQQGAMASVPTPTAAPIAAAPAAAPAPVPAPSKPVETTCAPPTIELAVPNPLAKSQSEASASPGGSKITADASGNDATKAADTTTTTTTGNKKADATGKSDGESGKSSEEATRKRSRTKLAKQSILAGPELYDPSGKLSTSTLSLSPDDVVDVPGTGTEKVQKIRGVITSVPRPSKQKDWFDVLWSVKDAAVRELLQSKIPGTSKNRDLLKRALVHDSKGKVVDESEKESSAKASAPESHPTSGDHPRPAMPEPVADGNEKHNRAEAPETIAAVSLGSNTLQSSDSELEANDETAAAVDKARTSKPAASETVGIPTSPDVDDYEDVVGVKALAAAEPKWDDSDEEQNDENGVRIQCHRCKKWHVLPESARDDQRSRIWFCEHNVYDPNTPLCPALRNDLENAPSMLSSNNVDAKKSTYGGKVCKDSPNLYDDYVKSGRPSRPGDTKMTVPQLVSFLFETHVIPILIRGGWAISKKARVVDESDDAKRASKDLLYVPPGVEAKAPFVSRKDYFDSKKGFMAFLESDKCKKDPLAMYALAFYSKADSVVRKEKAAQKANPVEDEAFDDMVSRINAKVDKKALKALKKAKLSLPPGVTRNSTNQSGDGAPEEQSSCDEVLATYQLKKPVKGKLKQKRTSSSPVVFSSDSDDDHNSTKKKKKSIEAIGIARDNPIFDDTESSGDEVPKSLGRKTVGLILEPGTNDVLIHAGGSTTVTNHVGNKKFRVLINEHRDEYLNAAHFDKKGITQSIVAAVGDRGGRFLKKAGDGREGWIEVDTKTKETKVAQDLRYACQKVRSEGSKAPANAIDADADSSLPAATFNSTKRLPKHVGGTTVKLFPSKTVVLREIVAPLVEKYRGTAKNIANSLRDDEIIAINIEDDAGADDQVLLKAEGIKEIQEELKSHLEYWINERENNVLDELEASDKADEGEVFTGDDGNDDYDEIGEEDESEDDDEEPIECRYRIGQEVEKVFIKHRKKPYKGKVTMLPIKGYEFYRVFYPEDNDEEDIAVSKISQYIVNDLGPPKKKKPKAYKKKKKEEEKDKKAKARETQSKVRKPSPRSSDDRASAATATSASATKEARKHFKSKYFHTRRIEYGDSGLNLNAVHKSMWKMHREILGDTCDDDCTCPSNLNLLVDAVKGDNEDHFKSTYKPVGFVNKFAPKFYDQLKEGFPHASPADLLQKLEKMWGAHVADERFGRRCLKKCACGEAWNSLFLDQCLRPKQQHEITKKNRESVPKTAKETIPKKKRPASDAAAAPVAPTPSSSGVESAIPKKKKRKTESSSTFKLSGISLEGPPVPKKGMTSAPNDTSIVPLRPSKASALTQRIKRKDRDDTTSASTSAASPPRASSRTTPAPGTRSAPPLVKMKEYSVSFNSKESLGFFVVTENQGGRSVCKITSVSPKTAEKDARVLEGTIVVGTGIVKTPVSTHAELRRRYEEERNSIGGNFVLHFINADVTASHVPNVLNSRAVGSRKGDWSTSGAFRGFSRVGGWDGGSTKKLQNQEDLEGAKELRFSRARQMPSVSRYMPRGSISTRGACSSSRVVSRKGTSGPVRSILKKEGDLVSKAAAKVSTEAADNDINVDDDSPRNTKIKFVTDEDLLFQVKTFSVEDDYRNVREEPLPPPGLRSVGSDALSYTIEHMTNGDIVRMIEEGAHVDALDSEVMRPIDRARRKCNTLKKQQRDLRARSTTEVVAELERVDAALKDAEHKYHIMKLYSDAEEIIDSAVELKDWCKMEITVKGIRNLDLTPKARTHPSKNFIFHEFLINGQKDKNRHPLKAPFDSASEGPVATSWSREEKYSFEFKDGHMYKGDLEAWNLEVFVYKGEPDDPENIIRLSKWRDSAARLRKLSSVQDEIDGVLFKNEFIHEGLVIMGIQVVDMEDEMLARKRTEISKKLSCLMDRIDKVRKVIAKYKGQAAKLPGNIYIPASHNVSLLHAAVCAYDEDSVKRLLASFGADPTTSSLFGSALGLACYEMEEARDRKAEPEVTQKLKRIIEVLRSTSAAKEKAATAAAATEAEAEKMKDVNRQTGAAKVDRVGEENKSDETKPTSLRNATSQGKRAPVFGGETSKRAVSNLPAWMSNEEKQASRTKSEAWKPSAVAMAATAVAGGTTQAETRGEDHVSRIDLPILSRDHWLPEVKKMRSTRNRKCRDFQGQGCPFGVNCRYAHIHDKVGPILDSANFTPKQRYVDEYVPKEYIYTLTRKNGLGQRFHTAAFCHRKDEIIYYAERGQGSFLSRQGVYWYRTLDHAMQAVQRVVYCIVSPEGKALRKGCRTSEGDGKRRRDDDDDDDDGETGKSSSSKRHKQDVPSDSRSRSRSMSQIPGQRSRSPSPVPPTAQMSIRPISGSAAAPPTSALGPSPTNSKLKWEPPSATSDSQPVPAPPSLALPPSKPQSKSLAEATEAALPSNTKEGEATDVSELPDLVKNWLKSNHRVQPPVRSVLNNDAWCRRALSEMADEKPEGYKIKTEMNDDTFTLYHTAAYVDPKGDFVYYSEQGEGGVLNPTTGVWWYDSEEAAKLAVRRVAAAAQKTRRDAAPMLDDDEEMAEAEEKPAVIDATKPAVNDDSSLSNTSISDGDNGDETALTLPPPSKVVDDLPRLDSRDWVKGKSVRCKYFNAAKGCVQGQSCPFAHVQSPIPPALLSDVDANKVAQVSTKHILQKEALTNSFDLYYTAAYLDPDENVIYYSQGGNSVGVNPQGIWWYSEEGDAVDAVKRVVVAKAPQRASKRNAPAGPAKTKSSSSSSSLSQNEVMRRLGKNPNLQILLARIFPGVVLPRTCWKIRHSTDGFSVCFLPPPETNTGIYTVDPDWRAGTMQDSVRWYKDERTAKNAAFMRFLELCVDSGYLKDTSHKLDGSPIFPEASFM